MSSDSSNVPMGDIYEWLKRQAKNALPPEQQTSQPPGQQTSQPPYTSVNSEMTNLLFNGARSVSSPFSDSNNQSYQLGVDDARCGLASRAVIFPDNQDRGQYLAGYNMEKERLATRNDNLERERLLREERKETRDQMFNVLWGICIIAGIVGTFYVIHKK